MLDESTAAEEGVQAKEFSTTRKGYDPAEVDAYIAEYDVALRELEEYAARLKQELAEARVEIRKLRAAEQESVDKAMLAVFDAKERIMDRARVKAQEIENEARVAAGLEPVAVEPVSGDEADDDLDQLVGVIAPDPQPIRLQSEQPTPKIAPVAAADGPDPAEALRQMVAEADAIRSQLESGLTSAFDEIGRMQRDAEARAAELLDDARAEALLLRRAGESGGKTHPKLEVTLVPDPAAEGADERRSRYSRNSAKLPRIGEDGGDSVLASMNQLRNKLREAEEVALQVKDKPAS